jgi:hypothetical protein
MPISTIYLSIYLYMYVYTDGATCRACPRRHEHEVGEDLCNCEFSLGDGAMIHFNNTRLHLKRGATVGAAKTGMITGLT